MTDKSGAKVSVLVVEDHELVAEGLTAMLSEHAELRVAGVAASVPKAVTAVEQTKPDVVLMDFYIPGGGGTVATRQIKERTPEVAVVFLSVDISEDAMLKAVEAGASGYVSKSVHSADLVSAILRAANGEFLLPAATMVRLLARSRETRRLESERHRMESDITHREREILRLMASGQDNHEIAASLGIGYGTVRSHVHSLLEKLHSRSRLKAVAVGRERGLID